MGFKYFRSINHTAGDYQMDQYEWYWREQRAASGVPTSWVAIDVDFVIFCWFQLWFSQYLRLLGVWLWAPLICSHVWTWHDVHGNIEVVTITASEHCINLCCSHFTDSRIVLTHIRLCEAVFIRISLKHFDTV